MTGIKLNKEIKILVITLILTSILVLIPSTGAQPGSIMDQPTGMGTEVKVLNITFSDDDPMEGDKIVISTYIKNNGPSPVTNITVSIILNNEIIKNITDVTLEANESKLIEYEWTTDKGQQNIGVLLYVNGFPIQNSMVYNSIYVEQEPLGDVATLFFAIIIIFVFVLSLVILPSILTAIRPEIKPYSHKKNASKK